MIQATNIPGLNPYRRVLPLADFIVCASCEQTYQPRMRLSICPHPIIAPRHLFPADTQIAIRHRNRPQGSGKRPTLVLQEPYYFLQDNEDPLRHEGLQIYLAEGPGCTLTALAEKWRKQYSWVRKVRDEDKWEVRRQAYFREQEIVQRAEMQKILKRDTASMLRVVRARLRMLSLEAAARLRFIKPGQGPQMAEAEFDNAMDKAVKLYRLLQEQSTEIISHDTPEMKHERYLLFCAKDIKLATEDERLTEGLSEEKTMEARSRFIRLLAGKYQLEEDEVSAAVDQLDRIEQSDSVS